MKTEDLKIESMTPKNKGGQTVGLPLPAVKVTHMPTGLSAFCNCMNSQGKCAKVAMAMIEYGLAEIEWRD